MPVSFACDHAQCPTTPYPNFTGINAKNRFLGTFLIIIVSLTTILKYKYAKGISINGSYKCL